MAFFNVEDFLKAATSVAQGQLQGKLQAQQEQLQRQGQETQNALQLGQLGAQQDEARFGQADAYDQNLQQTVLPRLAQGAQQGFIEMLERNRYGRMQDRARAQALRSNLVPAHLRPYFALPQSPTPAGMPTAPQPAPTDQAAATGAAPAPSPAALNLNWHPSVGMGQAPAAASAAAAPPPVIPPAAPVHQKQYTQIPGYPNPPGQPGWEVKGISDAEAKQYLKDRADTVKYAREYRGDAAYKAQLNKEADELPYDVHTAEELADARGHMSRVTADQAGNAARAQAGNYDAVEKEKKRLDTYVADIRKNASSGGLSASKILGIVAQEKRLAEQYPGLFDPKSESRLLGFEGQVGKIQAARALGTPEGNKRAGEIAQEVATAMRDNTPPEHAGSVATAVARTIKSMSYRDAHNKDKVEQALRVAGLGSSADQVHLNGVPEITGYQAERALNDWYKEAKDWAQQDDAEGFLARGRRLAEAAGLTPAEIAKELPAHLDLKAKPITPYQQALLTRSDKRMSLDYAKFDESKRQFGIRQAHVGDTKLNSAVTALLRKNQHQIDQDYHSYTKAREAYPISDDVLATSDAPRAVSIRNLKKTWDKDIKVWNTVFQQMYHMNPDTAMKATGAYVAPPEAGDGAGTTTPAAGKKSPAQMTDQELRDRFLGRH